MTVFESVIRIQNKFKAPVIHSSWLSKSLYPLLLSLVNPLSRCHCREKSWERPTTFFIRILFFQLRLNILIFLPILARK